MPAPLGGLRAPLGRRTLEVAGREPTVFEGFDQLPAPSFHLRGYCGALGLKTCVAVALPGRAHPRISDDLHVAEPPMFGGHAPGGSRRAGALRLPYRGEQSRDTLAKH